MGTVDLISEYPFAYLVIAVLVVFVAVGLAIHPR
jgi:hypothetical protein